MLSYSVVFIKKVNLLQIFQNTNVYCEISRCREQIGTTSFVSVIKSYKFIKL